MEQNNCTCTVEQCDIFDFMAKYVGLTVLHPGGFASTRKLMAQCGISDDSHILDIACGKGTSAVLIAKTSGCKVTGIDIDPELIGEAIVLAKIHKVDHLTDFRVGDATDLPFKDGEFDATIAQAMLVLIDDKEKVIREALRVLKPGGIAGWIELTWQREPTHEFMKQVSDVICAYCMLNVKLEEGWNELFLKSGARNLNVKVFPMQFNGLPGMVRDEGLRNTLRVFKKYVTDRRIRKRMNTMNRFFARHQDIFGFGIYTMTGKEMAPAFEEA